MSKKIVFITDYKDMLKIGHNADYPLDATYVQMRNIKFPMFNSALIPIGSETEPFTGTFDGNGFKIVDLFINSFNQDYFAMFGYVAKDSLLKNIKLVNPTIVGRYFSASLCVYNFGTIIDCEIVDAKISGIEFVSGLVCLNFGCIKNCRVSGSILCRNNAYELVGKFGDTSKIQNCLSNLKIVGSTVC